ncbi:MAG: hypothetical protein VKL39_05520 [Leptolyngbyaceae bacterium]|nr:hypothetical protein [Leptolyngbyaceae bacterium]
MLHLTCVALGLVGVGWLLAAFQVSWLIWGTTFGLALYLSMTGVDGLALSSAWVVGFVSVGAVIKAWPVVWGSEVPYKAAKFWALVFLLFWAGAIALIGLLATAIAPMKSLLNAIGLRQHHAKSILGALSWIALGVGWALYNQGHSPV